MWTHQQRKGQGKPGGRASSPRPFTHKNSKTSNQAGFMDKDKEDNGKEGNGNDNHTHHTPTRERRGIV